MAFRGQCVGLGPKECYNMSEGKSSLCLKCQAQKQLAMLQSQLATSQETVNRLREALGRIIVCQKEFCAGMAKLYSDLSDTNMTSQWEDVIPQSQKIAEQALKEKP